MNPITDYIESGILELYVMGVTTPAETQEVEQMAAAHPEIREEIETARRTIEAYALAHAVEPNSTVKPLVLATIDYMVRLQQGEPVTFPPVLSSDSRMEDYAPWLDRPDMQVPPQLDDIYVKIIGYTSNATTGIVWIKGVAEEEIHHEEHERFLILEGTCDITIDGVVNHLAPSDYFAIPLHKPHKVKVTSEVPCKVILQRLAV